jgi:hypothetical protein
MLSTLLARLKALIETRPAVALYGLAAIIAPVLTALGAGKAWTGGIVAILTALASVITAVKARPVAAPVILGAAATILSALTSFGLRLSPDATAEILSGLNLALAFAFHLALTPVVTLKAQAAERARAG